MLTGISKGAEYCYTALYIIAPAEIW